VRSDPHVTDSRALSSTAEELTSQKRSSTYYCVVLRRVYWKRKKKEEEVVVSGRSATALPGISGRGRVPRRTSRQHSTSAPVETNQTTYRTTGRDQKGGRGRQDDIRFTVPSYGPSIQFVVPSSPRVSIPIRPRRVTNRTSTFFVRGGSSVLRCRQETGCSVENL
jgi:hypothetical protein